MQRFTRYLLLAILAALPLFLLFMVLRQYLQLDDELVLNETYSRFTRYLPLPPVLPLAALPRVKQDATAGDAAVAGVAIEDVAVPRFVEELEAMGYFATLA